jgi:hypothetical protein
LPFNQHALQVYSSDDPDKAPTKYLNEALNSGQLTVYVPVDTDNATDNSKRVTDISIPACMRAVIANGPDNQSQNYTIRIAHKRNEPPQQFVINNNNFALERKIREAVSDLMPSTQ